MTSLNCFRVEVEALVNRGRKVCEARRTLAGLAVVKKGVRPVEVARYLGISRASVAAYRRKLAKLATSPVSAANTQSPRGPAHIANGVAA